MQLLGIAAKQQVSMGCGTEGSEGAWPLNTAFSASPRPVIPPSLSVPKDLYSKRGQLGCKPPQFLLLCRGTLQALALFLFLSGFTQAGLPDLGWRSDKLQIENDPDSLAQNYTSLASNSLCSTQETTAVTKSLYFLVSGVVLFPELGSSHPNSSNLQAHMSKELRATLRAKAVQSYSFYLY